MSYAQSFSVAITTDSSGDATAYTDSVVSGAIRAVRYVPGASPLDTGADVTVTLETTGHGVLTQANIGTSDFSSFPRVGVHNAADGAVALFAAAGEAVVDVLYAAEERIKVVIVQGGATKSGTFIFTVG